MSCSKVQRCERAAHFQSTLPSYSHRVSTTFRSPLRLMVSLLEQDAERKKRQEDDRNPAL